MNTDVVAASYLELLFEIEHQVLRGRSLDASMLVLSVDSDDVLQVAAELRRRNIRVATSDGVSEAATHAAPPPDLVMSAGKASLRSCDPAYSIKVPCE